MAVGSAGDQGNDPSPHRGCCVPARLCVGPICTRAPGRPRLCPCAHRAVVIRRAVSCRGEGLGVQRAAGQVEGRLRPQWPRRRGARRRLGAQSRYVTCALLLLRCTCVVTIPSPERTPGLPCCRANLQPDRDRIEGQDGPHLAPAHRSLSHSGTLRWVFPFLLPGHFKVARHLTPPLPPTLACPVRALRGGGPEGAQGRRVAGAMERDGHNFGFLGYAGVGRPAGCSQSNVWPWPSSLTLLRARGVVQETTGTCACGRPTSRASGSSSPWSAETTTMPNPRSSLPSRTTKPTPLYIPTKRHFSPVSARPNKDKLFFLPFFLLFSFAVAFLAYKIK